MINNEQYYHFKCLADNSKAFTEVQLSNARTVLNYNMQCDDHSIQTLQNQFEKLEAAKAA